jgi:hypothetical protein
MAQNSGCVTHTHTHTPTHTEFAVHHALLLVGAWWALSLVSLVSSA